MRTRNLMFAAGVLALALLLAWAVWQFSVPRATTTTAPAVPQNRDDVRNWLRPALGQSVRQAVAHLGLEQAERFWVDEPPFILRGASYHHSDNRSVTLFIAEGEPLYRKFSEQCEWDYDAFLTCKVGGIQYRTAGTTYDLGPAVPWQWAGERLDQPDAR